MATAIREVLSRPPTALAAHRGGTTFEQSAVRLAECLEGIALRRPELVAA